METSVCKLITKPPDYYGRLVSVRAVYVSSLEMEGLHDPNCSPNKWNGCDTLGRLDMHNLIEDKEAEEFERFAYATTGCCGAAEYKVTATFTGRMVATLSAARKAAVSLLCSQSQTSSRKSQISPYGQSDPASQTACPINTNPALECNNDVMTAIPGNPSVHRACGSRWSALRLLLRARITVVPLPGTIVYR